jgi:hypothetical protein
MADRALPVAPVALASGAAVQTLLNSKGEPKDYLVMVFQHQAGEFIPCFLVEADNDEETTAQDFLDVCAEQLKKHKAGLATPRRGLIVPGQTGD